MKIRFQDGTVQTFAGGPAMASEVLAWLGLNPASVILSRNGKVIPEDTLLGRDDEVRVTRVSHGG
jgi:sulfur carrier protein